MVTVSESYIALKHSIKLYASYRIVHVYSTVKFQPYIYGVHAINRLRHAFGIQDKKNYDYTTDSHVC